MKTLRQIGSLAFVLGLFTSLSVRSSLLSECWQFFFGGQKITNKTTSLRFLRTTGQSYVPLPYSVSVISADIGFTEYSWIVHLASWLRGSLKAIASG